MALEISSQLLASMAAHAERAYPEECCGALLGRGSRRGTLVVESVATDNVAPDAARRYEMDANELLALHQRCRNSPLEVIGYYHSHPDGPARPSESDRRAAWPDLSYLIVAVQRGVAGEARSWRLRGATFAEERLEAGKTRHE